MSLAFVKSLIYASPVAFGSIDMVNDQIIYSSGKAEELLGYSATELKQLSNHNFRSIVHPEDIEISANALRRLQESNEGEIVESIFRVRKATGEYIHLLVRDIVFERNQAHIPTKFTTIVQDISHTVDLERQLAEKVAALKEISFKNSHDLRAPVANIIGLVDLLKTHNFKTEFTERIFRYLEETVKKLDDVIHQINDMSNE